jgi:hypothetical protein
MRMLARAFVLLISLTSTVAVAAVDATTTAYYKTLVGVFFNVLLILGILLSLICLLWISIVTARTFLQPTLLQQTGGVPMTPIRLLAGFAVVTMLALPLTTMDAVNDLTGFSGGSSGANMCLVVDVTVKNTGWTNNASECIAKVESKASELAAYSNSEHIKSANLGLLFGIVQVMSMGFFLTSCWMLVRHIIGARDVKLTIFQAVVSILFSSAIMAAPSAVDYIVDLRGNQNVVISTE